MSVAPPAAAATMCAPVAMRRFAPLRSGRRPGQVKFRSGRAYLTFTELAGFIGVIDRATERVIFTNSNELADDIIRRPGLRVVRGIDFDRLEPADFRAIEAWLKEKPIQKPRLTPRKYQEAALRDIAACHFNNDRAHVVMACGTGKTLVALWAAERLGARRILVLLPSLSLMRQTLQEWSNHNSWGADYAYICVCSDPTVSRQSDEIRIDPTDIDFRVNTDPEIVKRFLGAPNQRVSHPGNASLVLPRGDGGEAGSVRMANGMRASLAPGAAERLLRRKQRGASTTAALSARRVAVGPS
jgi:Type III restriction enzyme, res subunit